MGICGTDTSFGDFAIVGPDFHAKIFPFAMNRGNKGRARSGERIEDEIVDVAARQNDSLNDRDRKLCGVSRSLARGPPISRSDFGQNPYVSGVLSKWIALELSIFLLIWIFNIWVTNRVQIERVVVRILYEPKPFFVSWRKGSPRCHAGPVMPDDFLKQKKWRLIPKQVWQRDGPSTSRYLNIPQVQPKCAARFRHPIYLFEPLAAPRNVIRQWNRLLVFFADVVRGGK
jgi:hypothetical protein